MAICENTHAFRDCVRLPMGAPVDRCNMTMVRTAEWKYVHFDGLAPIFFDLVNDPQEYVDLGTSKVHAEVIAQMRQRLLDWLFARRRTTGITPQVIEGWNAKELEIRIDIGIW